MLPVLITARMSSSRLPGKHLLVIREGQSALACLIERIKSAELTPVLCCADEPADQPLQAEAAQNGVNSVAGDPNDVLQRYSSAMSLLDVPAAIIVDGDDLFVSTSAMRKMLALYNGHDLIECKGLPYGGAPYLLSREFVDRLYAHSITTNGWTQFLSSVPGHKEVIEDISCTKEDRDLRLSLDYPEDLEFIRYLYEHTPREDNVDLKEVVRYIRENQSDLSIRFPLIFNGTIARRAATHQREEL